VQRSFLRVGLQPCNVAGPHAVEGKRYFLVHTLFEEVMPQIVFVESNGKQLAVEALVGQSVMQAAVNHMVPGIIADCGGSCSCATCHVYIDEAWIERVPPADVPERDMLECAAGTQDNSRLSCCIRITPALDGLVVRVPASQYGRGLSEPNCPAASAAGQLGSPFWVLWVYSGSHEVKCGEGRFWKNCGSNAGIACSAMVSGVQPSLRCTDRSMRICEKR
jgi:ferredoxin, 2Fe-2S